MPLDFPPSPSLNEIYTFGGRSWKWNGTAWDSYNPAAGDVVSSLNGTTGSITLAAGSNVGITTSGTTITISSTSSGGISGPYVISFNGLTGSVQGVSSFNGLTGSVQGVSSIRGLTGTVGLTNGSGISLSVSGNTLTVSNTGVLSIDGSTGTVTNVARTNVDNNFSAPQTIAAAGAVFVIDDTLNSAGATIDPVANDIIWRNGLNQSILDFNPQGQTVTLPNITTTLAGLAGTQTFTGTKTFNALTTFNAGITASGGTFSGNINLQNAEFIRNTTNGRIDFMPAPSGSTHYGLSVDTTSWGFGPRIGTIRSSDNATNNAAILWDVPLNLTNNIRFNFGSNGQNGVVLSDTGNDTIQFFTNVTSGTNSGAVAIVDSAGVNAANRAPSVTHTNPNLYIYRAGSARATDFIRFEHDGTDGKIVSGGTSGIQLEPGSGIVGISGGIYVPGGLSAAGGTFSALTRFNSGIVVTGATMSGTVSITGVVTPTTDLDAANKFYVDSVASTGIHYHQPVALASTDAETFASGVAYDNGASGVGATLRKTSSFARINIDGIDGSTGDRILVRSASTQQWNGVYDVTNQGSGSTGWILTRSSDANNYHPHFDDGLGENDYFFVQNGTTLKGNAYICSVPDGITFGTTAITFALFSTPPVYTAGTGLALNSLQFSNTGVLSFNGLTGAVTGVTTGTANTFGPLQSFTNGVSASGGATFGGSVNIVNTLLINGSQGSNNQVLTSTGSGITWATPAGGAGSVTSVEGLTGDVVLPAINFMLYNMGIV
jgi:hypothetical protein